MTALYERELEERDVLDWDEKRVMVGIESPTVSEHRREARSVC